MIYQPRPSRPSRLLGFKPKPPTHLPRWCWVVFLSIWPQNLGVQAVGMSTALTLNLPMDKSRGFTAEVLILIQNIYFSRRPKFGTEQ